MRKSLLTEEKRSWLSSVTAPVNGQLLEDFARALPELATMQETRTIEIVFRVENIDELASDSNAVRQEAILSECLQAGLPGGDSASWYHRHLYYLSSAMLLRDTLLLGGLIEAAYLSPLLFGIVSVIVLAGMNTVDVIQ